LGEAMNESLWDQAQGWFCARDVVTGAKLSELTVSSLMPLLDPSLPPDRRDRTVELARSDSFAGGCKYPLPSVATDSQNFDRRRYWRGPMWANTNWLVYLGARVADDITLARTIAEATLDAVSRQGFREYFDPISGEGLGAREFSWTAALTVDWLAALATPPLSLPSAREAT
jgi:neutral trehalase